MFEHPFLLIGAMLLLAAVYVILPLAVAGWRCVRARRAVACPHASERAEVLVLPSSAAAREVWPAARLRVRDCSLWPGRRLCDQDCLQSARL